MITIYGLRDSGFHSTFRYVGQTSKTVEARLRGHLKQALKKNHKSHKCDWIRKVYAEGRTIQIIVIAFTTSSEEADKLECQYIAELRTAGFKLTNVAKGGSHLTAETIQKLRTAQIGGKRSEETKEKLRIAFLGRRASIEVKAKMRAAQIARYHDNDEERRKTGETSRAAWMAGAHTTESIEKTAAAHRGMKRSEETCRKISEAKKGHPSPKSEETRKRMSAAAIGKPKPYMAALNKQRVWTLEMRAKHSASQKARWLMRKANSTSEAFLG